MIADARTSPTWRRCAHSTVEGRCTSCGARVCDQQPYTGGSDGTIGRGGVPVGHMVPDAVVRAAAAPKPQPTTCRNGHTGARITDSRGARTCRECIRAAARRYYLRRREADRV